MFGGKTDLENLLLLGREKAREDRGRAGGTRRDKQKLGREAIAAVNVYTKLRGPDMDKRTLLTSNDLQFEWW